MHKGLSCGSIRIMGKRRFMTKLHHLALGARDVTGLAEFYSDVLGLTELERHNESGARGELHSIWLDLGGGGVLMIEKTRRDLREKVEGVDAGLFLLALTAPAEEMSSLYRALEEKGIAPEETREFTRYYRDPEGNRFALSVYPLPTVQNG